MSQYTEAVYKARLAEQVDRYDEMAIEMKKVVNMNPHLETEQRNLLSVAYKNLIAGPRAAWKTLNSMKETTEERETVNLAIIKTYMEKIENQIKNICIELLDLLKSVIPNEGEKEAGVYYLKMMGDYHGYLAEIATGSEKQIAMDKTVETYKSAMENAKKHLQSTNPIRLGLALNFSVFYHDVYKAPDEACRLAKSGFDDAIQALDSMQDSSYKDSTLIMQLLRDNLTLWMQGSEGGD